jgi:hypothetical protein
MLNRFMITAATAALIAGTSFAYAQQGPSKEGPSGGAGTQQSAPSSGGAEHGMKSSQGGEKMQPQGAQNQRAQDMKSGAKEERSEKSAQETKGSKSTQTEERSKSTQNEKGAAGKDMKAEGREGKDMKAEGREGKDMKAEGREGKDMKAEGREGKDMKAEGREGMKAEDRQGREGKNAAEGGRMENRTTTTGQAGAGARLTTEQRTRISTVIRDQHVAPVSNVSFAVSVGTRVPREIGFHPLPQEIVTIYPEWRGYEFFLVRDEIVVVDPRTLEIVAVLPA